MKLEIRTHSDWYYAGCVNNPLLLSGAFEIKFGRKYLSAICNIRNVQSQRTLTTNICGIEVDEKGIKIM